MADKINMGFTRSQNVKKIGHLYSISGFTHYEYKRVYKDIHIQTLTLLLTQTHTHTHIYKTHTSIFKKHTLQDYTKTV